MIYKHLKFSVKKNHFYIILLQLETVGEHDDDVITSSKVNGQQHERQNADGARQGVFLYFDQPLSFFHSP